MKMSNLLKWAPAVGAFSRIAYYRKVLSEQSTYFDRLRIVNDALGANWVFRLADAVGIENIRASRPSWAAFYVDDCDRLHCPLDPGAPETAVYLGREYADMDMAFYAGMGFDGYRLVLQTPRLVDIDNKTISFDGRYQLRLLDQQRMKLDELYAQRVVPKEVYYSAYGSALSILFGQIDQINYGNADDGLVERTAAGCLILMCGGHRGCSSHITAEEEFQAQMESIIIFTFTKAILLGHVKLVESSNSKTSPLHVVTREECRISTFATRLPIVDRNCV